MKHDESIFLTEYGRLNEAQKEAVDTIEGPVMVVAGPGTGKTQILSLRIANILRQTDTPANGVLCLTFTNSGVAAMQERLRKYIGGAASKVQVMTFHSFSVKMIEEHYEALGYIEPPRLIDELEAVSLCDQILAEHQFQHLRTRANKSLYFRDIKSLVSLLKRERMSPEAFAEEISKEIRLIETDEANISTRGPSKGKLKQDAEKKIAGLRRTEEVVTFYALYELLKKSKSLLDYDDVLEDLVRLVETSDNARDTIREQYLYVLVDEHQDSSGVQNEFLASVWGDIENPNIFVVGDDRQLIYGFGGASLSYFDGFKETFRGVRLITLTENYRSTQRILDTADALLKSSLAEAPLRSNTDGDEPLRLIEAAYPRDEILRAGLEIKEKLAAGQDPDECAILVPKNRQVRSAMKILQDLGLPVASANTDKLFADREAEAFISVLKAVSSPETPELIAPLLLSPISKIPPLSAHRFLAGSPAKKLTLTDLLKAKVNLDSYPEDEAILDLAEKLKSLLECAKRDDVATLIQEAGESFFLKTACRHDDLIRQIEIIRTLIHLAMSETEKHPGLTLSGFLAFLDRLKEYDTDVPLASLGKSHGIKVITLHGSKGLEFECVYIAHLDERNLLGRKAGGFTLPERVKEMEHQKDEEVAKRELYVAITRAKYSCTLSYAVKGYNGQALMPASIIADLPGHIFERVSADDNEAYITQRGIGLFVRREPGVEDPMTAGALADLVKDEYHKRPLSVTHLNNFFECPWKWYFRNFLQLPERKTISLEFGNLVHGIIERLLKKKLLPDEMAIDGAIDERAEKLCGFSDSDIKRIKTDAKNIIHAWATERLPNIGEPYESEKTLRYRDSDFDHLELTGKIDLVETIDEGSVRVTDFKTGSVKKKSELEKDTKEGRLSDYRRQLAMYSYLIENATGGNLFVAESVLEFLEGKGSKDAMYRTKIGSEEIKRLRQDISEFDQSLALGEWVDRPCQFSPFRSGDECEYCRLAEIYKKEF